MDQCIVQLNLLNKQFDGLIYYCGFIECVSFGIIQNLHMADING